MNSVIETIMNRVSLRRYSDKPIENDKLNLIIESMKRAPTAGNLQMYSIILIEEQEQKDKLSVTCDNQPFIAKAPLVMVIVADLQKMYDYFDLNDCDSYCKENGLDYKGPQESDLMLAIEDAMCVSQNGVIAAESLGIGSCYIGDILEHYEEHKELLNLPNYVFPISMLTFGYYPEDFNRKKTDRFDDKFVVFKDRYRKLDDTEIKEMYKSRDERFKANNKFNAKNFAQLLYAAKMNSDFSKEMARSVKLMLKNFNQDK